MQTCLAVRREGWSLRFEINGCDGELGTVHRHLCVITKGLQCASAALLVAAGWCCSSKAGGVAEQAGISVAALVGRKWQWVGSPCELLPSLGVQSELLSAYFGLKVITLSITWARIPMGRGAAVSGGEEGRVAAGTQLSQPATQLLRNALVTSSARSRADHHAARSVHPTLLIPRLTCSRPAPQAKLAPPFRTNASRPVPCASQRVNRLLKRSCKGRAYRRGNQSRG